MQRATAEGLVAAELENSLLAKLYAAKASRDRGNSTPEIDQLQAFERSSPPSAARRSCPTFADRAIGWTDDLIGRIRSGAAGPTDRVLTHPVAARDEGIEGPTAATVCSSSTRSSGDESRSGAVPGVREFRSRRSSAPIVAPARSAASSACFTSSVATGRDRSICRLRSGQAWQEWQGSAFARVRSGVRSRDGFCSTVLFERT